jgi:NitT/TauT family transport system substrate-binding protein
MKFLVAAFALAVGLGAFSAAKAAETVHVGKSLGSLWAFLPADVGVEQGIFAKQGLDVDISDLGNGPKLLQGLTAGNLDFGLSAGSDMAFAVKGAPVRAVAAFAEEPRSVVIIVPADSPVKSPADLKGKLVGMPGEGSVAQWLAWRMAIAEGWGKDGIRTIAQGSVQANIASLLTHEVDGIVDPVEVGFKLEDQKRGRIAVHLAQYAPHFHAHIIFAREALIEEHPERVERFLKGFFASIAFIKANKEATSAVAMRVLKEDQSIADRTYDYERTMLLDDGRFDPEAIKVIKSSWVELGMLPTEPSDDQFLTTRFVPVKP